MAGKRQHYVPRFLQRGFLDPRAGAERTWLHRTNVPARLVGIGDIGVEDWFYSRKGAPGEYTLDDAITDYEQSFGKDVAVLRGVDVGSSIDAQLAARTVVHLVMRTAHLRRTLSTGVDAMLAGIEAMFSDPDRLTTMLGFGSPVLASTVLNAVRSTAEELVPAGFPVTFSERILTFFLRERGAELAQNAVALLTPMLSPLIAALVNRVRDSHNELIAKPLDDHGWVAILSAFDWSIEEASGLILPDAVAVSRPSNGVLGPLLFTSGADVAVVLLPIAHNRILIGRRDPAEAVDFASFNAEAAAACQAFFIAPRSHDAEGLAAMIGSGPAKALAAAVGTAIKDANETRSLAPHNLLAPTPIAVAREGFSYIVRLHDFGDDILAQEYADILQSVIGPLSSDLPLQGLDGITIAADYADGLAKLDRGYPDLPPVQSTALDYGKGAAMPVEVIRDGQRKEHLVFAAGIAGGWVSDDPALRRSCLHILIKMLAGVAQTTLLAGTPVAFTPDAIGRELHLAVARAPTTYWSAKQAAFVDPDQGESYADLVIVSFEHARSSVEAARLRMTDPSDVQEAFLIAFHGISAVLGHVADWLGHRDGLAEDLPFAGYDLAERLAQHGLDHWLALFGRDLKASFTETGVLDLNVVTTLSRHVERLFWSIGVYCWLAEDGVRCIVTDQPVGQLVLPSVATPRDDAL